MILRLPNELLQSIAENLQSTWHVNALVRTSTRLYSLLNSFLYRYDMQKCGSSALLWAATHGKAATALNHEADVQTLSESSRTPLILTASNGHEAAVKLLLATERVDLNSTDFESMSSLFGAAWYGHEAVVKLLLATEGIDPDPQDDEKRTRLSWGSRGGR